MIKEAYIQSGREELERGRETHEKWKVDKPTEAPKTIRYVVGFEHQEEIPVSWEQFLTRFSLEERVKIINHSAQIDWGNEYSDLGKKMNKTPHFDEKQNYIFSGYPEEIYLEDKKVKEKLRPVSLRYTTKDAQELYRIGNQDMGKNVKTLVFYDDNLVAQIEIKDEDFNGYGPNFDSNYKSWFNNLNVNFVNGEKIEQSWDPQEGSTLKYLEKKIRKKLGEDISSYELIGDRYADLLKRH